MKRFMLAFLMLIALLALALPATAQGEQKIAYGDSVQGEISNRAFEVIYTFDGTANDVVTIEMIAVEGADFDPYLYLTTVDNTAVAENDDGYNLNSRIIARLPTDGAYIVVATRREGRTGTGEGAFTLTLNKAEPVTSGVVLEGQAAYGYNTAAPFHVFAPAKAGIYTITYTHVDGRYYPALMISKVNVDYGYEEDVAQVAGRGLRGGSVTFEVEAEGIYILSIESSYFDYSASEGAVASYTIQINSAE